MGIRTKLVIAFAGLLLIVAVVGVVSIHTLNQSSQAIERILRENYDTVAACDHMKFALEKLDRQVELCLWEDRPEVCQQNQSLLDEFDKNLRFQQGNVTVPGEQELTNKLTESWKSYRRDRKISTSYPTCPIAGNFIAIDFCPDLKRSGR